MNISKDEAIRKHREMWNWIAEQYENELDGNSSLVTRLKRDFIKEHYSNDDPDSECYCCEYAERVSNPEIGGSIRNCERCPLEWPSTCCELMCLHKTDEMNSDGLYEQCIWQSHPYIANYKKAAIIAREIANLPERKIEEE